MLGDQFLIIKRIIMSKVNVLRGMERGLLAKYSSASYDKKMKILRQLGSIAVQLLTIEIEAKQVNHINEKNNGTGICNSDVSDVLSN